MPQNIHTFFDDISISELLSWCEVRKRFDLSMIFLRIISLELISALISLIPLGSNSQNIFINVILLCAYLLIQC